MHFFSSERHQNFFENFFENPPPKNRKKTETAAENCFSIFRPFFSFPNELIPIKTIEKSSNSELHCQWPSVSDHNTNNNDNKKFYARPQGVWERSFPVGSSSPFRGRRKGDPDTKVVWEQSRAARRNFFTLLYPFLLRKLFTIPFFFRAQREEKKFFFTFPIKILLNLGIFCRGTVLATTNSRPAGGALLTNLLDGFFLCTSAAFSGKPT